jgi:hypothetical protein
MLVTVLGTGNSTTTLTLLGLGQVPTFPTTCPKNLMFLAKNIHLLGLNFKLTSRKCFTKNTSYIFKPNWHHKTFIQAYFGDECCFFHIIKTHSNLPKPILQIQNYEPFCNTHLVEYIIN